MQHSNAAGGERAPSRRLLSGGRLGPGAGLQILTAVDEAPPNTTDPGTPDDQARQQGRSLGPSRGSNRCSSGCKGSSGQRQPGPAGTAGQSQCPHGGSDAVCSDPLPRPVPPAHAPGGPALDQPRTELRAGWGSAGRPALDEPRGSCTLGWGWGAAGGPALDERRRNCARGSRQPPVPECFAQGQALAGPVVPTRTPPSRKRSCRGPPSVPLPKPGPCALAPFAPHLVRGPLLDPALRQHGAQGVS